MKRKIIILCLIILAIVLSVIFFNKGKSDLEIYNGNDITLSIKNGTLTKTGATIIITDKSNKKHTYGIDFLLEKKFKKKWYKLAANETWWNLIGYEIDENNQIELKQNWNEIYGKLKRGRYRILKKVGTTDKYVYAEFEIK